MLKSCKFPFYRFTALSEKIALHFKFFKNYDKSIN